MVLFPLLAISHHLIRLPALTHEQAHPNAASISPSEKCFSSALVKGTDQSGEPLEPFLQ
jgi:hypothetical protein